jgi:hypothetical protein
MSTSPDEESGLERYTDCLQGAARNMVTNIHSHRMVAGTKKEVIGLPCLRNGEDEWGQ